MTLAAHLRADLLWRFGDGSTLLERMAGGIPDTGCFGNGNSGTKGAMSSSAGVDPNTIARFGRIERTLARCTGGERHALALAYGDAGSLVTEGGNIEDRRWQAVSTLTASVQAAAPAWAAAHPSRGWSVERERIEREREKRRRESETDEQKLIRMEKENRARDASLGDGAARYVHSLLSAGWSRLGVEGRAALTTIEREARGLLQAAEDSYGRAADVVAADTRDVRRTNERNAAAAGRTAAQRWERGE